MPFGQIGKYERLDVLGHGASGIVYLAKDTLLGKQVALKQISAQGEERERVLEEARVLDRLRHRNIVQVNGVNQVDGKILIDMEYIRGRNLQEMLQREPRLPIGVAVSIAIQICDGLGYAHARRTVHRDVKPANIIVSSDGVVKLVDFGLAEVLGTNSLAGGAGTYAYMAPEDFQGEERSDRQSDIWAAGVILYEMIAGVRPFRASNAKDPFSWKRAIEEDRIVPLSSIRSDMPVEIDAVIERALARNKPDRYADAGAMAEDLRGIMRMLLGEPVATADVSLGLDDGLAATVGAYSAAMSSLPNDEPTMASIPATDDKNLLSSGPTVSKSIGIPGFADLTEIDRFLTQAPELWNEACRALESGALANWLRGIGEEPLAAVANELSTGTEATDARLRDFLYRAGLDTGDEARGHYDAGVRQFDAGQFAEAETELRIASHLDPSQPHYFQYLARALRAQGDHNGAVAAFEEALRHHVGDRALRREYTELAGNTLQLTVQDVDFGILRSGQEKSVRVVLRNIGGGTLKGRVLAAPDWVRVEPSTFTTRQRQPMTLTADTSRVWETPSSHDEAVVLDTSGGRHQIRVQLTVLPQRGGFAQTWFWYLPLMICCIAPIISGLSAPGMLLASGLIATGLLTGAAFVVCIAADTAWSLRLPLLAVVPICLAAATGLLATDHGVADHRLAGVTTVTPPLICLLVVFALALWLSPKRWGRWSLWAAITGMAGIVVAVGLPRL